MSRLPCWIAFGLAALNFSLPARADGPPKFEWKDGDRVVLIGDTLIERDQKYGYLETLITAQNPDKSITFRNLGWSGDTVRGLSRARFGPPAEGFQHLKDHVLALKPTVLIVGYGMAESFDGEAGLPGFVSGMNELLDAVTASKPRLIFLSPIAHEDLGRPLPDPTAHNQSLALYRDAIRKVADERGGRFVDLFSKSLPTSRLPGPLTDDGIHPTAYGYWYLAASIFQELNRSEWSHPGDAPIDAREHPGTTPGQVRFPSTGPRLPVSHMPPGAPKPIAWLMAPRTLKVAGLKPGLYALAIDGHAVTTADANDWARGVPLVRIPDDAQVETLRQAINAKNELYFYRWRPQNETYLFGFRKHEQGNNAREIPLFDPLVEAKEKEIAALRKPATHVYELTRETEVNR